MLIPSNIKVKLRLLVILYIVNLLTVNVYISGYFFNYIDIDSFELKSNYYFDVAQGRFYRGHFYAFNVGKNRSHCCHFSAARCTFFLNWFYVE